MVILLDSHSLLHKALKLGLLPKQIGKEMDYVIIIIWTMSMILPIDRCVTSYCDVFFVVGLLFVGMVELKIVFFVREGWTGP